jgi:hypothetical protein
METVCLSLKMETVCSAIKMETVCSAVKMETVCSAVKMETVCFSETLVSMSPHGVTGQKNNTLVLTAVKTPTLNPNQVV